MALAELVVDSVPQTDELDFLVDPDPEALVFHKARVPSAESPMADLVAVAADRGKGKVRLAYSDVAPEFHAALKPSIHNT